MAVDHLPPQLSKNGFKFVLFFARSESNNNHHKVEKEMKRKGAVADPKKKKCKLESCHMCVCTSGKRMCSCAIHINWPNPVINSVNGR